MSLNRRPSNQSPFILPALIGVCMGIISSIPVAAYTASLIGDTYERRATAYCLLLGWCVLGGILLFFKTYRSTSQTITLPKIGLWCISVWLWPFLLLPGLLRKK